MLAKTRSGLYGLFWGPTAPLPCPQGSLAKGTPNGVGKVAAGFFFSSRKVHGLHVRFVFVLAYEPMQEYSAVPNNDTGVYPSDVSVGYIRRMLHPVRLTVVRFALLASVAAEPET